MSTDCEWSEYLNAARRKIEIADYHHSQLGVTVERESSHGIPPSIPLQSHFEGVLYAFVACCDRTAEAVNLGFELSLSQPKLRDAVDAMPRVPLRTRLFRWHDAGIAADLRAIRRRAVHHHYEKSPLGLSLTVERPSGGQGYGGSRTIHEYTKAAVNHLDRLAPLLDQLSLVIERRYPSPQAEPT